MNLNDQIDVALPELLAEHADTIDKLRRTEPGFDDLLIDHVLLIDAVRYWSGKSGERVEEFRGMARELEREIVELVSTRLAPESSRPSVNNELPGTIEHESGRA